MPQPRTSQFWSNWFTFDLAIDLGTASVLIHTRQAGDIVLREPSIIAFNTRTQEIEALGAEAKQLLGRSPKGIQTVRPVRDGMICEVKAAERMLAAFIGQAMPSRGLVRTRMVVSVPPGTQQVARRTVTQICRKARASQVFLVDQTLVAALGAGLTLQGGQGGIVVDVGGGTTNVAVLAPEGQVFTDSIAVGGDRMDAAIIHYLLEKYNVLISEVAAEELKWSLGSGDAFDPTGQRRVAGRDQTEGLPRTVTLSAAEIQAAMAEPMAAIVDLVLRAMAQTAPRPGLEPGVGGIHLTGGGSRVQGLEQRLRQATHLPCQRVDHPETAVVRGTASLLEDLPLLRRLQLPD